MKRSREIDRSLKRLVENGIPELRKGNVKMQSSPHVYDTNHEPAAITVEEERIPFPEKIFTVQSDSEQSMLLKKLGNNDTFEFQTESEVQYLVQLALEDALECLGLTDYLSVKPETSVFAYRPDIIVVYHSLRGSILVVEVKKPGVEVFQSHDVGGQVYDYLVGLLGTGLRPFCVLSSYDESCIAYLNDGGISKGILDEVASQMELEIPENRVQVAVSTEPQTAGGGSPQPKLTRVLTSSPTKETEEGEENKQDGGIENASDDDDSEEDPDYDREVMYTQVFSGRDSMKGLVLALRCAIESLHVSDEKDIPLNGFGASGSCALVNQSGLFWTNLPSTIKFDYYSFPGAASNQFYLWKDLGRGSKSRVFLACNSKGKACAAKFFLLDQSLLHREADSLEARRAERERQMTLRKEAADLECSRWIQAYDGEFRKQVRVVKLCGFVVFVDALF